MGPVGRRPTASNGNAAGVLNVLSAASRAAATATADSAFDFGKEPPGDAGFDTGRGVKRDGDAMGN